MLWARRSQGLARAVVAAGGAATVAGCVVRNTAPKLAKEFVALLVLLDFEGNAEALTSTEGSVLAHLARRGRHPEVREAEAAVQAALEGGAGLRGHASNCATASQQAAAAGAAATAGQASAPPSRPRRTCANSGCGAARGLRLCGGCGTVRYCSEACSRADWCEHRAECRRLQAEKAAAAEGSSSETATRPWFSTHLIACTPRSHAQPTLYPSAGALFSGLPFMQSSLLQVWHEGWGGARSAAGRSPQTHPRHSWPPPQLAASCRSLPGPAGSAHLTPRRRSCRRTLEHSRLITSRRASTSARRRRSCGHGSRRGRRSSFGSRWGNSSRCDVQRRMAVAVLQALTGPSKVSLQPWRRDATRLHGAAGGVAGHARRLRLQLVPLRVQRQQRVLQGPRPRQHVLRMGAGGSRASERVGRGVRVWLRRLVPRAAHASRVGTQAVALQQLAPPCLQGVVGRKGRGGGGSGRVQRQAAQLPWQRLGRRALRLLPLRLAGRRGCAAAPVPAAALILPGPLLSGGRAVRCSAVPSHTACITVSRGSSIAPIALRGCAAILASAASAVAGFLTLLSSLLPHVLLALLVLPGGRASRVRLLLLAGAGVERRLRAAAGPGKACSSGRLRLVAAPAVLCRQLRGVAWRCVAGGWRLVGKTRAGTVAVCRAKGWAAAAAGAAVCRRRRLLRRRYRSNELQIAARRAQCRCALLLCLLQRGAQAAHLRLRPSTAAFSSFFFGLSNAVAAFNAAGRQQQRNASSSWLPVGLTSSSSLRCCTSAHRRRSTSRSPRAASASACSASSWRSRLPSEPWRGMVEEGSSAQL